MPEAGIHPQARHDWVSDKVFKRLRLRSLQAAREATRPVPQQAYARLLLERQGLVPEAAGSAAIAGARAGGGALQGIDGVVRVIEQLAGVSLPASLREGQVFPSRVRDYVPGMLDELIATGTVLWSGHGSVGDNDGLVAFHLQEFAAETLSPPRDTDTAAHLPALQQVLLSCLAIGSAYFVRQFATLSATGQQGEAAPTLSDIHEALWSLASGGHITADTWAPLRAYYGARPTHRPRPANTSRRRSGLLGALYEHRLSAAASVPTLGDPTLSGRWSLLSPEPLNDTTQALARVEGLLDR